MSIPVIKGIERRTVTAELRADADFSLVGYAAKYNSVSKDLGGFREVIKPGAFTRSIQNGADVKCLFNHQPNNLLGRTRSGTLTLSEDSTGLRFRCQLDKSQQEHRDLYAKVQRGDIDECSFAFTVAPGGQQWEDGPQENGNPMYKRTLTDVDLIDVSAVTYPAYNDTSVGARQYRTAPDYGTDEQRALSIVKQAIANKEVIAKFRKATHSMARSIEQFARDGAVGGTGQGDEMALVRGHLQLAHEFAECANAMCDTARSIMDDWDDDWDNEDDDRAIKKADLIVNSRVGGFRDSFTAAHEAIGDACNGLAACRMHQRLGKPYYPKKK